MQICYQIDKDGNLKFYSARKRFYILGRNLNVRLHKIWKFGEKEDNGSNRVRSLHNEGGQPANRPGGINCVVSKFDQEIEFDVEDYHNVHVKNKNWRFKLPKALNATDKYELNFYCWTNANQKIEVFAEFTYPDGQKFVTPHVIINPKPYWLKAGLYIWVRWNNEKQLMDGLTEADKEVIYLLEFFEIKPMS